MTLEELKEKQELVKKLKSELKNEEMALVLLKKLKQSQTISRETIISGGATLTPANKNSKGDLKGQYSNKNNYDLLASADKLVSVNSESLVLRPLRRSIADIILKMVLMIVISVSVHEIEHAEQRHAAGRCRGRCTCPQSDGKLFLFRW